MTRSLFVSPDCHNLFLYFDPMSRMAVWKERLGGTGFGSADQPERWAGIEGAGLRGAGQGGAGQKTAG